MGSIKHDNDHYCTRRDGICLQLKHWWLVVGKCFAAHSAELKYLVSTSSLKVLRQWCRNSRHMLCSIYSSRWLTYTILSQSVKCPSCGVPFSSPAHLVNHLNSMTCTLLSTDRIPTSVPLAFFQCPGETLTGQYHPKLSYIFGEAEMLLDKLQNDEYEDHCTHNLHYPFQDKVEWELAKFLAMHLTSGQNHPVFEAEMGTWWLVLWLLSWGTLHLT